MSGVKMYSPNGDCHIALTTGHTFIVPGDKAGVEIPKQFRKDALARGCLPVGMEDESTAPDAFDRARHIRTKMKEMLNSDEPDAFTRDGKPALPKLSALCGFSVERTERDRLWAEIENDPDGDDKA
jgi:hypothetical protein